MAVSTKFFESKKNIFRQTVFFKTVQKDVQYFLQFFGNLECLNKNFLLAVAVFEPVPFVKATTRTPPRSQLSLAISFKVNLVFGKNSFQLR